MTEQEKKLDDQIARHVIRLNNFISGDDKRCLICDEDVTHCQKVGRGVYAQPCGHRQFQGSVPDWTGKGVTVRTKYRQI